jgi:hypothetical protein
MQYITWWLYKQKWMIYIHRLRIIWALNKLWLNVICTFISSTGSWRKQPYSALLLSSCWPLAWLILQPWLWRLHFPPKCIVSFNVLHCVISQKVEFFEIYLLIRRQISDALSITVSWAWDCDRGRAAEDVDWSCRDVFQVTIQHSSRDTEDVVLSIVSY